jgi:hypothetical protein
LKSWSILRSERSIQVTLTTCEERKKMQEQTTPSQQDRPHSHLLLSGTCEHFQELADRSLKAPAGHSGVNEGEEL